MIPVLGAVPDEVHKLLHDLPAEPEKESDDVQRVWDPSADLGSGLRLINSVVVR